MVVALVGALAVAGGIEAFVTPAPVPWALKITIGFLAMAALWAYTLILGGRAVKAGHSGDLSENEVGAVAPTAG